jgi:flagellar biosynthesis/type III secretory pathway M-ring protein FliF/YscJ
MAGVALVMMLMVLLVALVVMKPWDRRKLEVQKSSQEEKHQLSQKGSNQDHGSSITEKLENGNKLMKSHLGGKERRREEKRREEGARRR